MTTWFCLVFGGRNRLMIFMKVFVSKMPKLQYSNALRTISNLIYESLNWNEETSQFRFFKIFSNDYWIINSSKSVVILTNVSRDFEIENIAHPEDWVTIIIDVISNLRVPLIILLSGFFASASFNSMTKGPLSEYTLFTSIFFKILLNLGETWKSDSP